MPPPRPPPPLQKRQGAYGHRYLNYMYFPSSARFGPVVLGTLIAFLLPAAWPIVAGANRIESHII